MPELRRAGVERKLGHNELAALAGRLLAKWAKQVEMGFSIPPVRKRKLWRTGRRAMHKSLTRTVAISERAWKCWHGSAPAWVTTT
ncbi:hypothetical protein M8494_14735 [Serratia ureilytica]